ncbi:hypothetical protein V6Z11_1Z129800 [Gossypium hirsutum]
MEAKMKKLSDLLSKNLEGIEEAASNCPKRCYWIMDWHSITIFLDKLRNKAITFTIFQATCVLLLYVESN